MEDIAAVNALYRPGPMQNIDTFIARKKGKERIHYPDDSTTTDVEKYVWRHCVSGTNYADYFNHGWIFSWTSGYFEAKAISKKKKDVIDQERDHFVQGANQQRVQ